MGEETGFTVSVRSFQHGETIFSEGEKPGKVYWLQDGRVALSRQSHKICEVGTGTIIGAASVLLDVPEVFTVTALSEPILFAKTYTPRDLQQVFTISPDLVQSVFRALDGEARQIERRLYEQSLGATTDAARRTQRLQEIIGEIVTDGSGLAAELGDHAAAGGAFDELARELQERDRSPRDVLDSVLAARSLLRSLCFARQMQQTPPAERASLARESLRAKAREVVDLSTKVV